MGKMDKKQEKLTSNIGKRTRNIGKIGKKQEYGQAI